MVSSGKARFFRRRDGKDGKYGKYHIYLPVYFVEDSMFPFPFQKGESVDVKIRVDGEKNILLVEKWTEPSEED